MSKDVKYEGKEKIYHVKNKKRKIKYQAKILLSIILFILFFVLAYFCFNLSQKIEYKNTQKISYTENGDVSYKVYLKDNTFYEKSYLEGEMHYVASLINTINLKYTYGMHASDKINYIYNYDVVAKMIISERNEEDNILFTKEDVLIKNKESKLNDTNFVINENVDIDYDKYNEYVNNYKKTYSLDADAKLVVTMKIKSNGNVDSSKDSIKENKILSVTIPLSEQTINITKDTNKIEQSGTLMLNNNKAIESIVFLIVSIIFIVMCIAIIINIVYMIIMNRKSKTLYEIVLRKYLKEYDRAIVETGMPNIDESKFKDIIRVSSMEELIDLHDNFKYPILHYEVEKGSKSYFVVIKDDILYKLTISKAYLDKNGVK